MPLTAEEITKQIDNFLKDVAQKYLGNIGPLGAIQPQIEQAKIKEKFKKIIFAEHKDYEEVVGTLVPTNLTLAAQRLRLLRMGIGLDASSKRKTSLDGLQELSQVLGINGISQELEYKLAYIAIAFWLSNGGKEQEALEYFVTVRNILKKGGFLPFNVLEPSFVKLYYSFCIALSSWRGQNTGVHTAYDDSPFTERFGNAIFEDIIKYAVRWISDMTWLDLQDKIAIITTYQILSAKCYEQEQFCDLIYLKKAFEFATKKVEQTMKLKKYLAMLHECGDNKEERDKVSKEAMVSLFPELAARQAEKEAVRKAGIERAEYLEEWLRINRQQSEEYRRTAEQQARSSINAWATAAKKEANHQSYEKIKLQGSVMAATYVLVPYVAPYVAPVISGIAGSVGASAATAGAVGSTLAPVITRAAVSTTLNAIVNDDYKHLGKDLVKSAAINAVPAGVGLAVNVGETSTKAVEMMKKATVNMSKGATEAAFNNSSILQGTLISVASGAVSDKILKALPTEVGKIAALDSAISLGMQSTVDSLVKGKGDPVMDGLHKAAETFIVNQMGNSVGAGLQHALPPRNDPAVVVIDATKETLERERLAKEKLEKLEKAEQEQKRAAKDKGKDRVEDDSDNGVVKDHNVDQRRRGGYLVGLPGDRDLFLKTYQLSARSKDQKTIDEYDLAISDAKQQQILQDSAIDYDGFYDEDKANIYRGLNFARGFGKGMLFNTAMAAACDIPKAGPYIGAGLLFAGATSAYLWASNKLAKFEQDNFIFSEDYANIMQSRFISDEEKQQISRDAHARYEQTEHDRANSASGVERVKEMWREHPEEFGAGIGLFFRFGAPVPGVSTINANPIKPGLPFKIWTTKARIKEAMLPQEGRIRFIPPDKYNPSKALDRGINKKTVS